MSTVLQTSTNGSREAKRARFSLEHYEHMVACGAFAGEFEKRVELLWGEITEMSPIGPFHCSEVTFLTRWSVNATSDSEIDIRPQLPVRLPGSDSEPEPDICWVTRRDYSKQHPGPGDILLIIEVAETSLATDRGLKLKAYAEAGIADYWIVNLKDRQIEVYREPKSNSYQQPLIVTGEAAISPLALPSVELRAAELFY